MSADLKSFEQVCKPLMSAKDRRAYSLAAAIRASDPRGARGNCLEREVSDALSRTLRHSSSGILIPPEILFGADFAFGREMGGTRTLLAGNAVDGGYTVGAEQLPWIAYLAPNSAFARLGGTLVGSMFGTSAGEPQLKGDVSIPYESASEEAEWLDETQTATAGSHDSQFSNAVGRPHRVYAEREISKQLLVQAGMEIPLRRIIMGAYGRAIDRAILVGTGGVQPIGILNMASNSGVTVVSHGTDGGAPSFTKLVEAEAGPIGNNAALSTGGYVLSPNVREKLKSSPQFGNSGRPCLETIDGIDYVAGFPAITTTFMPDDGTKGTGTALGSFIFADWRYSVAAIWGALELLSDKYSKATQNKVVISTNAFMDTLHPIPGTIARASDVITT